MSGTTLSLSSAPAALESKQVKTAVPKAAQPGDTKSLSLPQGLSSSMDRRALYIKTLRQVFLREFQYCWDVANEYGVKTKDPFISQVAKQFKAIIEVLPFGKTATKAVDLIQAVVVGIGAVSDKVSQSRTERVSRLKEACDEERLALLLERTAQAACQRYDSFIMDWLSENPEEVIMFAKVGARRMLEFLSRQAVEKEGYVLSEALLLRGLIEGHSGGKVEKCFNTPLKLKADTDHYFDHHKVTAEGVYGRAGFRVFEIRGGKEVDELYVGRERSRKDKLKKAVSEKKSDALYAIGFTNFRKKPDDFTSDPKVGYALVTSEDVNRYGYRLQSVRQGRSYSEAKDEKAPSSTLQKKLLNGLYNTEASLSSVIVDKETLIHFLRACEKRPTLSFIHYIRETFGYRGLQAIIFRDEATHHSLETLPDELTLAGKDLSHVDFSGATLGDIRGARFNQSILQGAVIKGNAQKAFFQQARCEFLEADNVDFTGCDFTQAHLEHVSLQEATLKQCKTFGTFWNGAHLEGIKTDTPEIETQQRLQADHLKKALEEQRQLLQKLHEEMRAQTEGLYQLQERFSEQCREQKTSSEETQKPLQKLQSQLQALIAQQEARALFEQDCRERLEGLKKGLEEARRHQASREEVQGLEAQLQSIQKQLLDFKEAKGLKGALAAFKEDICASLTGAYEGIKKELSDLEEQVSRQLSEGLSKQSQRLEAIEGGITLLHEMVFDQFEEQKQQLQRIEKTQRRQFQQQEAQFEETKAHLVTMVEGQQTLLSFLEKKGDEKNSLPLGLKEMALQKRKKEFEDGILQIISELDRLTRFSFELPREPMEVADRLLKTLTYPVLSREAQHDIRLAQRYYSEAIKRELQKCLGKIVHELGALPPCEWALIELAALSDGTFCPGHKITLGLLIEKESEQQHPYFEMLRGLIELMINYQHQILLIDFSYHEARQLSALKLVGTPEQLLVTVRQESVSRIMLFYRASCLGHSSEGERLFQRFQERLDQRLGQPFVQEAKESNRERLSEESLRPYRSLATQTTSALSINVPQLIKVLETTCWMVGIRGKLLWSEPEERNTPTLLSKLVKARLLTSAFTQEVRKAWEVLQRLHCQQSLSSSFELTYKDKILLRRLHYLILQPMIEVLLPGLFSISASAESIILPTWHEAPIPLHQDIVTEAALDPCFYDVARWLGQWKGALLPMKAVKHEIEKAITRLVETLCERPTSAEQFRFYYALVPDAFKFYYYATLKKQLSEQLRSTAQALSSLVTQYGEEQKSVSHPAVEEHFQLPLSLSAEALLKAVSDYPCKNGQRPLMIERTARWHDVLSHRLTQAPPSELCDKEGRVKKEYRSLIQVEWVSPENRFSIQTRILAPSLQERWRTESWIDEQGQFTEKAKEVLDGRGYVLPIHNEQKHIIAYAKAYPEMPGMQSLAQSLAWAISGEGPLSTVCKFTCLGTNKSYPVLLIEAAGGTLQHLLRREGHLARWESQLDSYRFSLKILENLMLSYEDDKFDNLSTTLVSFDCDRVFVESLQIEKGTFSTKVKVNNKTALYCFNHMQAPLHPEAVKVFCALDPYQVLCYWLEEQDRLQGATLKEQGGLFKTVDADKLRRRSVHSSTLHRAFVRDSGLVTVLYQRFRRIQAALEEEPTQTHFSLLRGIEPHLASFYEEVFSQHDNAMARFHALPTDYVVMEDKRIGRDDLKSPVVIEESGAHDRSPSQPQLSLKAPLPSSPSPPGTPKEESPCLSLEAKTISPPLTPRVVHQTPWKVSQTLSISNRVQLTLKEAIEKGLIDTPLEVLKKELGPLHYDYEQLSNIREALIQGNLKPFQKLGQDKDYFKERIVNTLDFEHFPETFQQAVLDVMKGGQYFKLCFKNMRTLTDERLKGLLKSCPNLHTLEVRGHAPITGASLETAATHCVCLERLVLNDLPSLDYISQTNWWNNPSGPLALPALRKVVIEHCARLTVVAIDAPRIERLRLETCPGLIRFKTQQAQFFSWERLIQKTAQRGRQAFEERDAKGNNLLHQAAHQGHSEQVQWLLERYPEVIEDRNDVGDTALMMAARFGYQTIVEWIVQRFPSALHATNHKGERAFDQAAEQGHLTVMEFILEHGEMSFEASRVRTLDTETALEPRVFEGHRGSVLALAVLPEGGLASGSLDATIKVWDLSRGVCERTLEGHRGSVLALAVLPEGGLASGSLDATIKMWDLSRGVCERTLEGHRNGVFALAVLPEGRLASGSLDVTIKVWDLRRGVCEQTLEGHSNWVSALAALPEGRLASGSYDKTIKLWNLGSGTCERTLEGHRNGVFALAALPEGRLASGSYDKTIKLWNLGSGTCERTLEGHRNGVFALAVLPEGRLASGSYDKTIKVWNLGSGMCERTLEGHRDTVSALAVLPKGRLASGSLDKTIKVWQFPLRPLLLNELLSLLSRLKNNTSIRRLQLQKTPLDDSALPVLVEIIEHNPVLEVIDIRGTAITLKGVNTLQEAAMGMRTSASFSSAFFKLLNNFNEWDSILLGLEKNLLTVLAISQITVLHEIKKAQQVLMLKEHHDGIKALAVLSNNRLASGSYDRTIKLWNLSTGICERTLEGHSNSVLTLAVLPNGRLASGSYDHTIKLWNLSTGVCDGTFEGHSNGVSALVVFPNGRLASGSYDKTIKLWNLGTRICERTLEGHTDNVNALAVLPNGWLASGSNDNTIKLWDLMTGVCERTLKGHRYSVKALAALPDGRLGSGSDDNTIKLWNLITGTCEQTLEGHRYTVYSLAVLLNRWLVSTSSDTMIKLWDLTTGICERNLEGHCDHVSTVVVLPNGQLASGSDDNTIRLWGFPSPPLALDKIFSLLSKLRTNTSVRILQLQETSLDDSALPLLVQLIEHNTILELIDIRNTAMSAQAIKRFEAALERVNKKRFKKGLKTIELLHGSKKVFPAIAMTSIAPEFSFLSSGLSLSSAASHDSKRESKAGDSHDEALSSFASHSAPCRVDAPTSVVGDSRGDSKQLGEEKKGAATRVGVRVFPEGSAVLTAQFSSLMSSPSSVSGGFSASQETPSPNLPAIRHFKGEDKGSDSKDLRQFNHWYGTQAIESLVFLKPSQSLRCVFHALPSIGDVKAEEASGKKKVKGKVFENQLRNLQILKNRMNIPQGCFIGFEPDEMGSNSHFIFGIMLKDSLVVIDPLGAKSKDFFCQTLNVIRRDLRFNRLYLSRTPLQKDPEGLVSCGTLCTELMLHISQIEEALLQVTLASMPVEKQERVLSTKEIFEYHTLDIAGTILLPSSCQGLLTATPDIYIQQMTQIRQSHLRLLETTATTESDSYEQSLFNYLTMDSGALLDIERDARFQQVKERFGLSGLVPSLQGSLESGVTNGITPILEKALKDDDIFIPPAAAESLGKPAFYYKEKALKLSREKRYQSALECYEEALQFYPEDMIILNNMGVVLLYLEGGCEKALFYFGKISQSRDPDYDITLNNKGNAEYRLGRYQEAIDSFRQALALAKSENRTTLLKEKEKEPSYLLPEEGLQQAQTKLGELTSTFQIGFVIK